MKVWKNSILPMICLIAFFVYVIFANIYKAKWRGEEPWTKENLLRVGAFFIFVYYFYICLISLIYFINVLF